MRVSVLVTTYNQADFIEEAIASLLSQDHGPCEIIVVDDGSTDNTVRRARAFERHGVTVIAKGNQGVSHSMNLAMSLATGDAFVIQSGDDASTADRVSQQVAALADPGTDIVISTPNLIDAAGNALPDTHSAVFFRNVDVSDEVALFKSLFYDGNFICAPSVAMKRQVATQVGRFHEGLLQLQDYDYWMRAASLGLGFRMLPQRVVNYRLHAGNLSSPDSNTRLSRELTRTLRSVAARASIGLMLRILYQEHEGFNLSAAGAKVLAALLLLRHDRADAKQVGFEILIDVLDGACGPDLGLGEFGLDRAAIFSLLNAPA